MITRAAAAPMDSMIRAAAAVPVHVPLLELLPTGQPPPTGCPDIALITSATTAGIVPGLAQQLAGSRVVAVGRKTAAALERGGVTVHTVGTAGGAQAVSLVTTLWSAEPAGRIWSIGARALSPQLRQALDDAPWPFTHWPVYTNAPPSNAGSALAAVMPVDVVTFASGSAARTFAEHGALGGARVVVIGPSTAADVRAAGLTVDAVAAQPSLEALVEAALSVGGAG